MKSLTFEELRAVNTKRCNEIFHSVHAWNPLEWAGAMCGEAGEAANICKKIRRIQDGTNQAKDPQSREDAVRLLKSEVAGMVIYADLLAARCGFSLGDAVRDEFNAVSKQRNYEEML